MSDPPTIRKNAKPSLSARRAWIEISRYLNTFVPAGSLSARRAWIEMTQFVPITTSDVWSLSARRAWIEMLGPACLGSMQSVALRKESVDRNRKYLFLEAVSMGRSPQGERG